MATHPSLIRKDPPQKLTPLIQLRPLRRNRRRDRIVTADTNTENDSPAKDPDHLQFRSGYGIGQTDDHDNANHSDDEFIAIHETSAVDVTQIAEAQLTDDVANVRGAVDETS